MYFIYIYILYTIYMTKPIGKLLSFLNLNVFRHFGGDSLILKHQLEGFPVCPHICMKIVFIYPGNQPPFQEMVASFWMTINPYVPKKMGETPKPISAN